MANDLQLEHNHDIINNSKSVQYNSHTTFRVALIGNVYKQFENALFLQIFC